MSRSGPEGSTEALGRFASPRLGPGVWAPLWALAVAAELGALLPIVSDRGAPVTVRRSCSTWSAARSRRAG